MAKQKKAAKKKSSTKRGQQGRNEKELGHLGLGAKQTEYPTTYSPDVLEAFPNQHPKSDAWTTFVCPEFTSLCPKTGQPDFAKIVINYIADKKMVESKSLKIYLFSFRNHGDFHEDCIQKICDDLQKLMRPRYLEVVGEFTPRGGLAIFPYASCDNGQKAYKELRQKRFAEYSPGKYSLELGRPY
jgi:7-cyano-7-deazaguanine reductase